MHGGMVAFLPARQGTVRPSRGQRPIEHTQWGRNPVFTRTWAVFPSALTAVPHCHRRTDRISNLRQPRSLGVTLYHGQGLWLTVPQWLVYICWCKNNHYLLTHCQRGCKSGQPPWKAVGQCPAMMGPYIPLARLILPPSPPLVTPGCIFKPLGIF